MNFFDFHKTIVQSSADSLKRIAVFNPFSIHKKGTRTKALFALAAVCFLWGTTWIASKEGVKHMPALQLAGIRQLSGGVFYVAFFLWRGVPLPKGREWIPVIVLSFLNFIMSNGLSTWGVQFISAGLGAIMGAIFPLWLVVIGIFSSKEKIPAKAIAGLSLGFAGVCVIFSNHLSDFMKPEFSFGVLLSLVATWTWAFGTLYTKKHATGFNPYFSLGLQMMISGFFLLILTKTGSLFTIEGAQGPQQVIPFVPFSEIPWQSWAAIGYLALFGSIIAFVCYLYALQNLPIEQASIYAYVNPVVAVFFGWLLFGEKITIFITAGGLIALLGVYLVNKAFKAAVPPPEQPEPEGM